MSKTQRTALLLATLLQSVLVYAQGPDFTPQTPLLGAAMRNDTAAVQGLLRANADPNEGQLMGMGPWSASWQFSSRLRREPGSRGLCTVVRAKPMRESVSGGLSFCFCCCSGSHIRERHLSSMDRKKRIHSEVSPGDVIHRVWHKRETGRRGSAGIRRTEHITLHQNPLCREVDHQQCIRMRVT